MFIKISLFFQLPLFLHEDEKDHRIKDLQAHNESLEKDKERAGQEKEAIQNLYNNYMRQMQTLITQKSIEAPGNKRPWWRFW